MILSYKKQEKTLHPLAWGTQKHAVLGNLKGTVTKPADDRRQQIELRIFLRSPDSPRADLNALPMQNSVTVRRQISSAAKAVLRRALRRSRVTAGWPACCCRGIRRREGGGFSVGLITHSLGCLSRQLGYFVVWHNSTLWVVKLEARSII